MKIWLVKKMIDKRSYYVSKNKKERDVVYFEYNEADAYKVTPKVKNKDAIEVNKIVFVNDGFSEKIIRKKIDKKIAYLLEQLNDIESGNGDEGTVKRTLIDAEKLRLQIINNYVKYLGHTYHSLTLKKIEIIIDELRYKLYEIDNLKKNIFFSNMLYGEFGEEERETRKGR